MIGQAQKVIAVVMDLFTDIDIFKDLLDASYRRKVAVYIMLEATGVKHFMRMCEKAGMHTGHLKNLRVRSIRGAEFLSRSSKRVYGSQSQKFMFIDGDKAVSGSYSFTWSASRLDRNLITVLTGQAVDTFDTLFQDMYMLSNGVCLSKINLSSEPEPEYVPQAVPTPLPSATKALKLINPKYTLVSNCAFTTNGPVSDQTSAQNSTSKNQTEVVKVTPVVPPVHPGLLNLEKADMINYIPTWPDPDPPSDVIGFINIRDANKPLQAHLMRSELFEVSQAIRFKDPVHEPVESSFLRASPGPVSQTSSHPEVPAQKQTPGEAQMDFDKNQHQTSNQSENLVLPLEKPKMMHVLAFNKVDKEEPCVSEKDLDTKSLQSKNICTKKDFAKAISSFQDDTVSDTKGIQDTLQPLNCSNHTSEELYWKSSAVSNKSDLVESFAIPKSPSVKQSQDDQIITDVVTQNHIETKPETNQNGWNGTKMSNCDSSMSSLSDEYYECFSPVADFRSVEDIFVPEETRESLPNPIKKGHQGQAILRSKSCPAQDCEDLGNSQNYFTPKLLKTSCSIIFNFLSAECKTTAALSKTTFAQENDKGAIINDSKQPVKDSESCCFLQTPNGYLNFSLTSDEYFECSDTVGLKSEIDCVVSKELSSAENINEPQRITKLILEAEKLPELGCQNIKEKVEPEMHSGQEQPEFQHVLHMTADSNLPDGSRAVLLSEDNTQAQSNDKLLKQVQDSEVTSKPAVDTESMSSVLQQHMARASQQFLERQTKAVSVELTEKMSIQDLQIESLQEVLPHASQNINSKDKFVLFDKRNSNPEFESEVSVDVVCEEHFVKSLQDLQPELSSDLIPKPPEVNKVADKMAMQDLQLKASLNLMCEGSKKESVQGLQPNASLDLIGEVKPLWSSKKNSESGFVSEVSVDLVCEEQSVQTLQDLHPGSSSDLQLKTSEVNVCVEKSEKKAMQDLQLEEGLDLVCEESEKESLQGLQPDTSLGLTGKENPLLLAKKISNPNLECEVNRDVACEEKSVKSLQDLQPEPSSNLLLKPTEVNVSVEVAENNAMQDLQLKVSLEESEKESPQGLQPTAITLIDEEKPLLLAMKHSDSGFLSEVSVDVVCEEHSVKPLQDLQPEVSLDLMLKPAEGNVILHYATDSVFNCSILQDKADVTSVIPEKPEITKLIELPKIKELQKSLTCLDCSSKHQHNLRSEEDVNEHLRLPNDEVSQAVLKIKSEQHNSQMKIPEQFESIELLILEDSDLQMTEQDQSDPGSPIVALSKETKICKTKPIQMKTTIDRKLTEEKLGHEVYSRNGKETCYPTAPDEEKQEGEHICTNQTYKNLPEAKPKMESLARKHSLQTSSRIPIQARRGSTKLPIGKLDTSNCSSGLQAPKCGIHKQLPGKPMGQKKTSITPPSSPEKPSIGKITPVRPTQIPQRPTWTVPTPNSPTSPTNQNQQTAPRIKPPDQPNVSRSASMTKYSRSSYEISCTRQVKKQAVKGILPSP
ncbi:uncharacterized protein fam83ga isoform X2 [Danio rerio]